MAATTLGTSEFLLEGPSRSIVIGGAGESAGHTYSAFALRDGEHLRTYRAFLESRGAALLPSPTALFDGDAFAVFCVPPSRADHHAYETTGWNDLELWADHFASLEIPIWWGPGRHGAGSNLFFMIRDPDGNNIEISAGLETMEKGKPG